VPYLVVIEQQCLDHVWNAVALASGNLLKYTLNESERITSTGI
jgi:hypothetical protein